MLSSKGITELPKNERQIRPLTKLPPETAEKVWLHATEISKNQPITERIVRKATKALEIGTEKSTSHQMDSWQLDIFPLLRDCLKQCKAGDREAVEHGINKIELLLGVGCFKPENEAEV